MTIPKCSRKVDGDKCIANADGKCICLAETDFGRPCPFFKDRTKVEKSYWVDYKNKFRKDRRARVIWEAECDS